MGVPLYTRLRFLKAKEPEEITIFLSKLPYRVQIYGAPVWTGKAWILWFVPPDDLNAQVPNVDLTE